MRLNSNFKLVLFCMALLIFTSPLLSHISAQNPSTAPLDEQLGQFLGAIEIIVRKKTVKAEEASQATEKEAIADAKRDAKAHLNKTLWFTSGCFLLAFGPIFSQRTQRSVPTARTLGKSPQYVAFYTDAYKIEMKKLRFTWALGGCVVGSLVDGCLASILINRYTD